MKANSFSIILLIIFSTASTLRAQSQHEAVTFEQFVRKLDQTPRPQILDVRTPEEFAENHLIGAINLPAKDSTHFEERINRLEKTAPVFVYSINNGRSAVIASKLRDRGFKDVYQLPGGIAHWLGAGQPVESSIEKGMTKADFDKLLQSDNVVLVSVGSKYCGSCRKVAPIVEQIKQEQNGLMKVVRIELYENREIANELGIEAVPTVVLFKGTKPIWRKSGLMSKSEIQDALDNSL